MEPTEAKVVCKACNGEGGRHIVPSIPHWHPDYGNAGSEWDECPECHGTGYLEQDEERG